MSSNAERLEDVAAVGGDAPRWYRLYRPKDRDFAVSFLERVSPAGYGALVVTLDAFTLGWRPDVRRRAPPHTARAPAGARGTW